MLDYQTIDSTGQRYHLKGINPSLLIVSGIHGDEAETAGLVEKTVELYYNLLPDFLYIRICSPSAVSQGTRTNNQGHDLNRSFLPKTDDIEAQQLMNLLKSYHFKIGFDFHEDPIDPNFYAYDCFGKKLENSSEWNKFKQELTNLGVNLLNGVDDPNDPALGIEFRNGLHYFADQEKTNGDGMIGTWLKLENLTEKYVNPEIPGTLSIDKKTKIIDAVFRRLILKDLS